MLVNLVNHLGNKIIDESTNYIMLEKSIWSLQSNLKNTNKVQVNCNVFSGLKYLVNFIDEQNSKIINHLGNRIVFEHAIYNKQANLHNDIHDNIVLIINALNEKLNNYNKEQITNEIIIALQQLLNYNEEEINILIDKYCNNELNNYNKDNVKLIIRKVLGYWKEIYYRIKEV